MSYRMSFLDVTCRCTSADPSTLHHTGGKESFTHLLDIREQQRDHSVCYLLCSSKSWHNGGSIKHKENSQLSWVAGTLWKDLDHRKILVVQTSRQMEMHIWLLSYHQNLQTPACKLQQVLLAQLKSSPLTAATLTRGYCSCSQTWQTEMGADGGNQNKAAKITCDLGVLLKTQRWTAKKLTDVMFNTSFYTSE